MGPLTLPAALTGRSGRDERWDRWLDGLPRLASGLVEEWGLTVTGEPLSGAASLVLPVSGEAGDAMLKLAFPDEDGAGEIAALQLWGGRGAARLVRADPRRDALLLERLGDELSTVDVVEACAVVAGLYGALHRPAAPQLRPVATLVGRWLDDLEALGRGLPAPPRFVEQALHAGRALLADPGPGVVLHGDLHYANVLRRGDEWAAIDPKGFNGDPCYELAPLLWNRWEELFWYGDAGNAIRERFYALVDGAGLDERRCRDWVVVRSMIGISWEVLAARRAGRLLDEDQRAWITRCVTTAKAMQAVGAG
ncbi:aminoglycoside phosphotransferase family protein [Nigerium massiliense]|uniref:aminoglycoside phosphotransferase family protein n=1 Tax=Nigerium massiliense TaxID=1522317 RepID=UPI0005903C41|nr:aminoglycoside phosphotransferase family protein [Nigerium massiliense]